MDSVESYVKKLDKRLLAGGALILAGGLYYSLKSSEISPDTKETTQYVLRKIGGKFVRLTYLVWNLETDMSSSSVDELKTALLQFKNRYDILFFTLTGTISKECKKILIHKLPSHELAYVKECKALIFYRKSLFEKIDVGFNHLGKHNTQRHIWLRLKFCGMTTTVICAGCCLSKEGCEYEVNTLSNPRHEEAKDLLTSVENHMNPGEPLIIGGTFHHAYPSYEYISERYAHPSDILGTPIEPTFPSTGHLGPCKISEMTFVNDRCHVISTRIIKNFPGVSRFLPISTVVNVGVDYDQQKLRETWQELMKGGDIIPGKRETKNPSIVIGSAD